MGTLEGAGEGGGGSEMGTLKEVKMSDGGRLLKLLGRVGKPELVLERACCTVEQRQTS